MQIAALKQLIKKKNHHQISPEIIKALDGNAIKKPSKNNNELEIE